MEGDTNTTTKKAEETNGIHGKKRPSEDVNSPELPIELKKMFKPLNCELCNVEVESAVSALAHYKGRQHLKNVNAYLLKNNMNVIKRRKLNSAFYKCEVCNIELSSEIVFLQHMAGKQHKKNVRHKGEIAPKIIVKEDPTGRFGIGEEFLKEAVELDKNTIAVEPDKNSFHLFCDICNISANNESQMNDHKQGQRHKKKLAKMEGLKKPDEKPKEESAEYYDENNVWKATPDQAIPPKA